MSQGQQLTRVQLAKKFEWEDNFPKVIQDRLFEHYIKFRHSEADIQSASDTLVWAAQKKPMGPFLAEHKQFFGTESAHDLESIIDLLAQMSQQTPQTEGE